MKRGINVENNVAFSKYKLLAIDIYEWCVKHDLWGDNTIYFDGKAWSNSETWHGENGKKIAEDLYEYEDRNPRDYFEYANSDTLSMSFEGSLNHVLNGYTSGYVKYYKQFNKLFDKYHVYWEFGNSWNFTVYEC